MDKIKSYEVIFKSEDDATSIYDLVKKSIKPVSLKKIV